MKSIKTIDSFKALEILDRIDFFMAFSAEEKEQLASMYGRFYLFNPGESIVREGELCDMLYIVLSGKVKVHKLRKTQALAYLSSGEIFGEISFLTQQKRISSVSAYYQSIVLEMDQSMMLSLSAAIREKIKDQIIYKLVNRLDRMNARMYEPDSDKSA